MTQRFVKTKPSFLEAGLPCASLSAECQRDNNARQRPPQNRLHIWWARRPPTICRVAILSALLPFDMKLPERILPSWLPDPTPSELDNLPGRLAAYQDFYRELLANVNATQLTDEHRNLLLALGITGDGNAAYRRLAFRDEWSTGSARIPLPDALVYRHPPAFAVSPGVELIREIHERVRKALCVNHDQLVVLDSMAGGGAIPLEAIRFGAKVYANELNPVAAIVLKATLEYPARFGRKLTKALELYAKQVSQAGSFSVAADSCGHLGAAPRAGRRTQLPWGKRLRRRRSWGFAPQSVRAVHCFVHRS